MNPQVTEEDQDRFHRRYHDHNDEISVHSDEEDSEEDEYVTKPFSAETMPDPARDA